MQKVSEESTWCTDPKAVLEDCNISTAAGNAIRPRPSFCLLNMCIEKNISGMWRKGWHSSFISQKSVRGYHSFPLHDESICNG